MSIVTAVVIGVIFGAGVHLMVRRDAAELAIGSLLVTNAAVLLLVTSGFRVLQGAAYEVPDPLAQSLALTAVVIGFGTTVLLLRILLAVARTHQTIDLEDLVEAEAVDERADGRAPSSEASR